MNKTSLLIYLLAIGAIIGWVVVTVLVVPNTAEVPVVDETSLEPLESQLELEYISDLQARAQNKITPELEL
jgi:hypothetical protein